MPVPPGSIFLCYRRDDSADVAGRIYDRLVIEFGKEAIFRDVDTIPFGEDFRDHIRGCLASGRVGLVVIGPEWCSIKGRTGQLRLHEAADHVRIEVETMLAGPGMKTIPLFVRGATPPDPSELPETLHPLAFKNGPEIRRDPDFHHDMERLIARLRQLLPEVDVMPAPATATTTPSRDHSVTEAPRVPAPKRVEASLPAPGNETPIDPAVQNSSTASAVVTPPVPMKPDDRLREPATASFFGWRKWRQLEASEYATLALPFGLAFWSVFFPAEYEWRFGVAIPVVLFAAFRRRWEAMAVAALIASFQPIIFWMMVSRLGLNGIWFPVALIGIPGALIILQSPSGPGSIPREWWRNSRDLAACTPKALGWVLVAIIGFAPWWLSPPVRPPAGPLDLLFDGLRTFFHFGAVYLLAGACLLLAACYTLVRGRRLVWPIRFLLFFVMIEAFVAALILMIREPSLMNSFQVIMGPALAAIGGVMLWRARRSEP